MIDHYSPTVHLRFEKRKIPAQYDPRGVRTIWTLVQKWTSDLPGEPDEWRDVPFVSLEKEVIE